jgi:hypothetical protein
VTMQPHHDGVVQTRQESTGREGPLVVSEQEEQLIRACCLYQFLTIPDMVYVLHETVSLNYMRKLAARLAGNKDQEPGQYLYRFRLGQRASGNALRVFVPGEASQSLLGKEDDADGLVWTNPSTMQRYSYSFVYHNLAVTRLCLCASLFCRERPEYYLSETRLSYSIARQPPRISLTTDGKPTTVPVIPDSWLFIERVTDGHGIAVWFEVDNGTTYRKSFHRRLSARLSLITSEAYSAYFGTDAILLCFAVLGNEARMHTLRHWTWDLLVEQELEELASRFRFSAIKYETLYEQTHTLFAEPAWRLPTARNHDDPTHVTLLPPPQDKEETDGTSQATVLS